MDILAAVAANEEQVGVKWPSPEDEAHAREEARNEIAAINQHTQAIEFHGNSSSMAFLNQLHLLQRNHSRDRVVAELGTPRQASVSLVSTMHDPGFSPTPQSGNDSSNSSTHQLYFRQAYKFIEAYFDSLHYIHPFMDKADFMTRAEDLWFGRRNHGASFVALYFGVLSLGALIGEWDTRVLDGLNRFQWSRKLFHEAQSRLRDLHFSNDLDTVQCLYFMAKVCQNELNPHLSYMYLGLAIRTCLSAGFNREITGQEERKATAISRTWWGLYSLEVEMSFALGRPDTLGDDEYHNRRLPQLEHTEADYIPLMVDLARIMRNTSIGIYHTANSLKDKLHTAFTIEQEMETRFRNLPANIRPDIDQGRPALSNLRDPKWVKRQRLVLHIRFHNVRMLMFRPFLSYCPTDLFRAPLKLQQAVDKCVQSAIDTLKMIYDIYQTQTFFRSW